MSAERIILLLQSSVERELSSAETAELDRLMGELHGESLDTAVNGDAPTPAWAKLYQQILDTRNSGPIAAFGDFDDEAAAGLQPTNISRRPVHRVHFLRTAWLRYAAAILIILGIGGYLWLRNADNNGPVLAKQHKRNDSALILPGTNRAMLVLGDESVIALDTAANGVLTRQGESDIIKTEDGQIVYTGARKATSTDAGVYYQKVITPRGGTYQVTLADGTQAWLNAQSSIRFPNIFSGDNRTVEITGEVYFEVKGDKAKPFVVKTPSDEITVLGTRFNVNAYANEQFMKTTLVDGAVRVNHQLLSPGQAFINGKTIVTNVEQDIAWMSGTFSFSNADIQTVMRQLARWYDVDVKYEQRVPKGTFSGDIDRHLTLQQVLKILSTIRIKYRLENKTLTILSDE